MSWLASWKTSATLAVLGALFLVWVLVLRTPINWGHVVTGVLVVGGCAPLAVMQRRAQHASHENQ